jgi:hypothetical protein
VVFVVVGALIRSLFLALGRTSEEPVSIYLVKGCLSKAMRVQLLFVGSLAVLAASCQAFVPSQSKVSSVVRGRPSPLRAFNDKKDEAALEEDTRLKIYESRRMQIRAALKSAEALRNFRLEKGTNSIFSTCQSRRPQSRRKTMHRLENLNLQLINSSFVS